MQWHAINVTYLLKPALQNGYSSFLIHIHTHPPGRQNSPLLPVTVYQNQGCGVDRVFIWVDSDSGVCVLMSTPTPTPTPGPTPVCLEWIALCNVQFLCIGHSHSYARHLIVGQVKLQGAPKRDDPTWTRPGPDRVGRLLPPYHNWTLFVIALDQRKTMLLNPRYQGHREPVPLIWRVLLFK